jgi:tubulin polyglutamylase TTLL9
LEKEGCLDEATQYDFFPITFVLPREYAMFVEEFKRVGGIWIMKPIGSAQGKGIFLFTKLSEISGWKTDTRYRPEGKRDESQIEAYVVQVDVFLCHCAYQLNEKSRDTFRTRYSSGERNLI